MKATSAPKKYGQVKIKSIAVYTPKTVGATSCRAKQKSSPPNSGSNVRAKKSRSDAK